MEGSMSGLKIASFIVRNDLDDLCPEYRLKRHINKSFKKVKLDKLNLEKELSKLKELEKEVEYVLYKPFQNDKNLALLYLLESPNCTELLELLKIDDTQTKTRAISMLLFILEKRVYSTNMTFSPFKEAGNELNLAKNILNLFSKAMDSIFVNDDVIINYTLKLIFECVKRLNLEYLSRFLSNFNLIKYLNKCHVTTHPDVNFTIYKAFLSLFESPEDEEKGLSRNMLNLNGMEVSLRRTLSSLKSLLTREESEEGEVGAGTNRNGKRASPTESLEGESESEKEDLYYSNGKIKLAIILLLGIKGVRLQKDLVHLVFSHFKHEHWVTQVALAHLGVCYLSRCFQSHSNEAAEKKSMEYLINNVNNSMLQLQKLGMKVAKSRLYDYAKDGILREFILVLNGNVEDSMIVTLLLKYDLWFISKELDGLYRINGNVYKQYVNQINVGSASSHAVIVEIMVKYLSRGFDLPEYVTKGTLNSLLSSKSMSLLNNVFQLFIKIMDTNQSSDALPDIKTIINLNPATIKSSEEERGKYELEALGNWLELLYRSNFGGLKGVYDPLKLFKIAKVSENYTLVSRYLLGFLKNKSAHAVDREIISLKNEHGSVSLEDEEALKRVKIDMNLMSCVYQLGINDSLVISNLHYKCLKLLLARYVLVNAILTYHSEESSEEFENKLLQQYNNKLRRYLKLILSNVLATTGDEGKMEQYVKNVNSVFLSNVIIVMYNIIIKSNLQLLYPLREVKGAQASGVFIQQYKCLNCILNGYFQGNIYMKLFFEILLQVSKYPESFDVNLKYYRCVSCNDYYVNFVGLFDSKYAELQLLRRDLVEYNEGTGETDRNKSVIKDKVAVEKKSVDKDKVAVAGEKNKSRVLVGDNLKSFTQYVNKILIYYVKDAETREYLKMQVLNVVNHLQSPLDYFTTRDSVISGSTAVENKRLEIYKGLAQSISKLVAESRGDGQTSNKKKRSTITSGKSSHNHTSSKSSNKHTSDNSHSNVYDVNTCEGRTNILLSNIENVLSKIGSMKETETLDLKEMDKGMNMDTENSLLDYVYCYVVKLIETDKSYKKIKNILKPCREESYDLGLLSDYVMNKHKTMSRQLMHLLSIGLILGEENHEIKSEIELKREGTVKSSTGTSHANNIGDNAIGVPGANKSDGISIGSTSNGNNSPRGDARRESTRKLILFMILVNNNTELQELIINNKRTFKLLVSNLQRLKQCRNNCTYFTFDAERSNRKHRKVMAEILYSDWFMEKCELILRRKYYYLGYSIETKLYKVALKILYFMFYSLKHEDTRKMDKDKRKRALGRYYVLLKDIYKCTNNKDDVMIKQIVYKIIRVSNKLDKKRQKVRVREPSDDLEFYLKLLDINHFKLVHYSSNIEKRLKVDCLDGKVVGGCSIHRDCNNSNGNLCNGPYGNSSNQYNGKCGSGYNTHNHSHCSGYNTYNCACGSVNGNHEDADDVEARDDRDCHGYLNNWLIYNKALVFKTFKGGDLGQLRLNLTLYNHNKEDNGASGYDEEDNGILDANRTTVDAYRFSGHCNHSSRQVELEEFTRCNKIMEVEEVLDYRGNSTATNSYNDHDNDSSSGNVGNDSSSRNVGNDSDHEVEVDSVTVYVDGVATENGVNVTADDGSGSSRISGNTDLDEDLINSLECSNSYYYNSVVDALLLHENANIGSSYKHSLTEDDILISKLTAFSSRLNGSEEVNKNEIMCSLMMPDYYKYDLEYLMGYVYKLLLIQYYSQGPTSSSPSKRRKYEFDTVHVSMNNVVKLVLCRLAVNRDEPLLTKMIKIINRVNTDADLKYILYHIRVNRDLDEMIHIISLFNTVGQKRDRKQVETDRRVTELDRLVLKSNMSHLSEEDAREMAGRVNRLLMSSLLDGETQMYKVVKILANLRKKHLSLFKGLYLDNYIAALKSTVRLNRENRVFIKLLSRLTL
ncbi:conserved hypothetical protein [Theileria orientalis strain Shintoku]|uniref:Uncharacterized protein n=1 Tax=Theileria orientalis strain Shintoku TaxID=869250 RepID=J4D7U0_THEOR|nr:conserved hypothetical protein [Theileria orientalis strain Shintoku]BAM40355.1 conserved hypothetical protein [Theileria orientalis strain Shintoku]|eukprot:XP_009690656.1 conserved hypothetical protein [Theileria orientalis strain Shintoku]